MSMLPTPHDNLTCPYRERAEKAERERDSWMAERDMRQTALEAALVEKDGAERRLAEAREDIKALEESMEAARERDKWPPCGCSFDRPGDVCGTHWPGRQELVEDIKALALVLRAAVAVAWHDAPDHETVPRATVELLKGAEQRIRSRRLLEQENG